LAATSPFYLVGKLFIVIETTINTLLGVSLIGFERGKKMSKFDQLNELVEVRRRLPRLEPGF
jgi:hypothetical protein